MTDPLDARRSRASAALMRLAQHSKDPEVAEFAREVTSGRHTTLELLSSSAYDGLLRRRFAPVVAKWQALGEADRERAVTDADRDEERFLDVLEQVTEAETGQTPTTSRPRPASPHDDDDYFEQTTFRA